MHTSTTTHLGRGEDDDVLAALLAQLLHRRRHGRVLARLRGAVRGEGRVDGRRGKKERGETVTTTEAHFLLEERRHDTRLHTSNGPGR